MWGDRRSNLNLGHPTGLGRTLRNNLKAEGLALISALTLLSSCLQTHCAENLLKADTYRKWRAAKAGEKTISVVLQVILPSPFLLLTRDVESQGPDSAEPTGSGLSHFPCWASASLPGRWASAILVSLSRGEKET